MVHVKQMRDRCSTLAGFSQHTINRHLSSLHCNVCHSRYSLKKPRAIELPTDFSSVKDRETDCGIVTLTEIQCLVEFPILIDTRNLRISKQSMPLVKRRKINEKPSFTFAMVFSHSIRLQFYQVEREWYPDYD